MAAVKVDSKSKAFSMQNWDWKKCLLGNWVTIKEVIKLVAPGILGWLTTHNPMCAGIAAILGKPLLDALHYYIKNKP